MAIEREDTHSFDWRLACQLRGVEKAILVGNFHFWITVNEGRKSAAHFREGEYWTYATAADLVGKYPYMKGSSIYRWLNELEETGWIKRKQFRESGNLDQRTWFGRGKELITYVKVSIPHSDKSNSQNDKSNYQNEEWNYQNDNSDSQNGKSDYQNGKSAIYKDTDNNSSDNKSDTTASAESADVTAEPETVAVEEKKNTPINPVARPPSSPELPVPKKIPGDGRLRKLVGDFYREHPDLYPVEMYTQFIDHWTLPVLNSQYEQDIGKEQWQTSRTFDIPKKLAKWYEGYLNDQLKTHESATRSNQSTNGHHPTARPRGAKTGSGKPVKRSPVITPDKLRRDGQSGGNTTQNGYGGTTVVDVDRGDYSVEDSAPE